MIIKELFCSGNPLNMRLRLAKELTHNSMANYAKTVDIRIHIHIQINK